MRQHRSCTLFLRSDAEFISSGLLTRFPFLTALAASGVFFCASFVVLASCLLPAIEWRAQGSTEVIDPGEYEKEIRRAKREVSTPVAARTARPKRSRSLGTPTRQKRPVSSSLHGSVRTSDCSRAIIQSMVKEEGTSIHMASSSRGSSPLRRRRSRQLHSDD